MQRLIFFGLLAALVSGCLSTQPVATNDWSIDPLPAASAGPAKFGVARLSMLAVRAPYDSHSIPVLRQDGTVAFDPYNRFAATPSQLLRWPTMEALGASGRFAALVGPASLASADLAVEVLVAELALDCRTEGMRTARAQVLVRLVDRKKAILKTVRSEGTAEAADGNYGAAFSSAYATAIRSAVEKL